MSASVGADPGPNLQHRDDALTEARVGNAHDDRVEDRVERLERRLDLLRVHLLAAGVDRDRAAPEQRDRAVVLDHRVVARHRPPHTVDDGERRGGLLRDPCSSRAGCDPRREQADDTGGERAEIVAEHGRLVVDAEARRRRDRRARDGDRLALSAGLRRAVAVDEQHAGEPFDERPLQRGREDRAAGEDHAARRQVEVGRVRLGTGVERVEHRSREGVADDDEEVRLLARDQLPQPHRRERAIGRDDHRAAEEQRREGHPVRGAVHERAGRHAPGAGNEAPLARSPPAS